MNPSSIIQIELGNLTMGDNPRLPHKLKIPALAENIGSIGLTEPLHVWSPEKNDVYEIIRGHRRTMALTMLKDQNPKRFKELFSEGISAILWGDITAEDAVILKLDHGGQETLSDPHELQMSANLMFGKDFTEAQVANQLKPLITRISPMQSKQQIEIDELEAAVDSAKESKKEKAIDKAESELTDRIAKMYRGRVQHLHDVYRCPHVVNASLYFKACGQKPEGFEDEKLPKLTTSQVNSLWKSHKEDLEIMDEETKTPKYNKTVVGPNFATKWEAIIKTDGKPAKDPKQPKKSMSAKDITLEVTEGKWESIGFCKLSQRHAGSKSIDGLEVLDKDYKAMDLIRAHITEYYDMVIAEASKIEAELVASDKEAASVEETKEN